MNSDKKEIIRKLEDRRMERLEVFKRGDLDAYERLEPPLVADSEPKQNYVCCDIVNAIPKDDIGSMEYPMFSLSKNPDYEMREYEYNKHKVSIVPSGYGLATIWDKDILIYCVSQLIARQEQGRYIARTLWIKPGSVS